jgi:MFS transporter, CP family, cyanate transporter
MAFLETSFRVSRKIFPVVGVLLIAASLRAPFTQIAPLLSLIKADLDLSTVGAGALTTLPLLAFAIISPWSALIARKFGLEKALFGAMVTIAVGVTVRSGGNAVCLFLGTSTIGVGIAVGNVLLPSLVKRDFRHHVAALTGMYVLVMCLAAALASGIAVPLADDLGWRSALASVLLLLLAAIAVWMPRAGAKTAPALNTVTPADGGKIWRSALAWQVTLFLGLNSTISYVVIAWLPTILTNSGYTPAEAGSLHGVMQLAQAIPGLVLGPIFRGMRGQRIAAVATSIFSGIALLGLLALPHLALVWVVLFGIGTGAGFILGLTFISLRTGNSQQAAALSGMAQCCGYSLAALGPMAMGAVHDALGGWYVPLALCSTLAGIAAITGALAGRDRHLIA